MVVALASEMEFGGITLADTALAGRLFAEALLEFWGMVLVDVVVTVVLGMVVVFSMVVEFAVWFGMLNVVGLLMPWPSSPARPKIAKPSSNAVSNTLNA